MTKQILGVACGCFLSWATSSVAQVEPDSSRVSPVLNFVGVTGHAWGMWVQPGVEVEDWVDEARGFCVPEEFCEVNVFEGPELATHEYPVPERNRRALRWVFVYRQNVTPRIVIEAVGDSSARSQRRWTIDR